MSRRLVLMISVASLLLRCGSEATAFNYGGGGSSGGGSPTATPAPGSLFAVANLVSTISGEGQPDPHLTNAWGLVAGPATPWWTANNKTSTSTLYSGTGSIISLVVSVPGAPSGIVFNGGSQFVLHAGVSSASAAFLFSTESGVISGWSPTVSPTAAITVADRSGVGAIYKGLAIAGNTLYATDFHNARVDVFDGNFNLVTPTGAFVDKKIPKRFAPFGIQNINGTLFVTYAKPDKNKEDDVPGAGLGFVDMFDTSGKLLGRVASKGPLNAPWGLAMAPSDFGAASGDLLVGNFGNGKINTYQQRSNGHWKLRGPLKGGDSKAIKIDGLWALEFGNGGPAGPTNTLFFTAGPQDESQGVFGSITPPAQ
jgi:uncharacterized protein (TIGR03118 family)